MASFRKIIQMAAFALMAVMPLAAPAAAAPETLPPGGSCISSGCHEDLKQPQFLHGPLNMNQCEPCHVPVQNKHEFTARATGRDLCFICHEAEGKKQIVHAPFESDCTVCHNPHSSEVRYFVKGGGGAESCQVCHTDVREGLDFVHGPVGMGECLACHTPHQSDHAGLLIEKRADLCLGCHVDVQQNLEGAVSIHAPVKEECAGCHSAHGGATQYFLPEEGQQLCRSCHEDFLKEIDSFHFTHHPMVEGKTCQNCHQAHSSNQEDLLAGEVGTLCLSCHNQDIQGTHGTIDNVAAQVQGAKFLHGPLKQGNCAACHSAHGSNNADILDKAFPGEFYTPYAPEKYDLCFDCHDRSLVTQEQTTETGFRNGTTNLHYLHVNREKGRSCRACHHEHASNQPRHIRSEVPFGRWTMKIDYAITDTGGTCSTGCHMPFKYDRENAINNKAKEGGQ